MLLDRVGGRREGHRHRRGRDRRGGGVATRGRQRGGTRGHSGYTTVQGPLSWRAPSWAVTRLPGSSGRQTDTAPSPSLSSQAEMASGGRRARVRKDGGTVHPPSSWKGEADPPLLAVKMGEEPPAEECSGLLEAGRGRKGFSPGARRRHAARPHLDFGLLPTDPRAFPRGKARPHDCGVHTAPRPGFWRVAGYKAITYPETQQPRSWMLSDRSDHTHQARSSVTFAAAPDGKPPKSRSIEQINK
uniref:uncharacterized protein LOC118538942 isoform X2 n=1 Tax=Halichoerus grypus TaxID=9711 RepID=UPI001659179D|nr:uncharacterized protein LOC118538942 isoform X2 [Halichoerus grypus]XP_035978326.1 uncharacterized protein LOC118554697 isoform X2 [Halichoerus grypus]